MFWLRNKKNNFQLRTLIWGPERVLMMSSCRDLELALQNMVQTSFLSEKKGFFKGFFMAFSFKFMVESSRFPNCPCKL